MLPKLSEWGYVEYSAVLLSNIFWNFLWGKLICEKTRSWKISCQEESETYTNRQATQHGCQHSLMGVGEIGID
jgi:hypothetical protein